jgi:hypothetical protein
VPRRNRHLPVEIPNRGRINAGFYRVRGGVVKRVPWSRDYDQTDNYGDIYDDLR